jgi:hypothetical protein
MLGWMLGWVLGWLGLFCSGVKNKRSNGNSFFANLYLVNQFQIITNGKIVNTLIEDIDSSEYVVNADQDPEDEIEIYL